MLNFSKEKRFKFKPIPLFENSAPLDSHNWSTFSRNTPPKRRQTGCHDIKVYLDIS